MSDSHAEQLDPSKLGEEVGDDQRAAADFPPDEPMAVDDPSILADGSIAEDDYRTRDGRHVTHDEAADDQAEPPALIEPGLDPDVVDDEQQLIADTGDRDPSPEAAAVHLEPWRRPDVRTSTHPRPFKESR
ncbi:MAG: hypothetical protein R2697_01755 [Ilumatobacteraceae bacterium]